jgi:hypothetical protein
MMNTDLLCRVSRADLFAVLLLVGLAVLDQQFLVGDGIENPWISMTGPWCPLHGSNPILGYSWYAMPHDLLHNENISIFSDQAMLAGQAQNQSFYALRPGVGLVSFVLFWLNSATAAGAAVALMSLLAATSAYALARISGAKVSNSVLLAALTYTLGCVSFHLKDLGAHLGGPALWLLTTALVIRVRPWRKDLTLPEWVLLHAAMTTALLFYWSNVVIYLAFVFAMAPNWRRLGVSFAIFVGAYQIRTVWPWLMNHAYGGAIDYLSTEQRYLQAALESWRAVYERQGIEAVVSNATRFAAEAVFAEPQFLLCSIFVGTILAVDSLRHGSLTRFAADRRILFAASSIVGALGLLIVWAPSAYARGYLAYGAPLGMLTIVAILVGKLDRTPILSAIVPVGLVSMFAWQIVWVKSPLFGNPMAECQYLLAQNHDLSVFSNFVAGFRHPLTFIPLQETLSPQDVTQLARVVRASIANLGTNVSEVAMGTISYSRDFVSSLLLCGFLLLPPTIALVFGLNSKRKARWRIAAVAPLVAAIWFVSWWAAPRVKADGVNIKPLYTSCSVDEKTVSYSVTLPEGALAFLRRNGVETVEFFSGWRRSNESTLQSVAIVSEERAITHNIETQRGVVDIAELGALSSSPDAPLKVVVVENYLAPLVGYVGWQTASALGSSRGGTACGSKLEAFVEVRAFRQLDATPTIFFY